MEENDKQERNVEPEGQQIFSQDWGQPGVFVVLMSLVGLVFAGAILGAFVSLGAADLLGWDRTLLEGGVMRADAPPEERWPMRFFLAINHLFTFLIPAGLVIWAFYRRYPQIEGGQVRGTSDWRDYLALPGFPAPAVIGWSVLLMLAAAPLVLWLYEINQSLPLPESLKAMEDRTNEAIKGLLQMDNPLEFAANLAVIALLPALGEELLFRGVLQKQLMRFIHRPWTAILLASAIFSFIHLQFEGFLPRWLLGIILGWLYWRSGNFWVPVIAHFFNNGIQVVAQYLYSLDMSEVDLQDDVSAPWYAVILSIAAGALIIRQLEKTITSKNQEYV